MDGLKKISFSRLINVLLFQIIEGAEHTVNIDTLAIYRELII